MLRPGTILRDHYLVGRVLGAGGFGITYLAWDRNLSLKIAIKEYFPSQWAAREHGSSAVSVHSNDAAESFRSGLERFLDEGRTLARFHNVPGIVAVLGFFRENNTGYLAMSYVDGITLKQYLEERDGKIPFDVAVRILMPVMDALAQVHEVGVLHRDISPDNIYITASGQVKLLDFGAARMAPENQQHSLSVIYKPGFAPPEQYMSQGKQGRWTDVYALAATLYRAVTGIVPAQSVERFYKDDLAAPSALGIAVSPGQEAALLRALSVDFAARFQTMREFQRALLGPDIPFPIEPTPIPGGKDKPGESDHRRWKESRKEREPEPEQDEDDEGGGGKKRRRPPRSFAWLLPVLAVCLLALGGGAVYAFRNSLFPEPLVDPLLQGRWEMPRSIDGLALGAHWQLNAAGTYTLDFIFKDDGEFQVFNGSSWSTTSAKNPPKGGTLEFQDANTISLSGFYISGEPKVTLKRRTAVPAGKKGTAYSLIGIWESSYQDIGIEGKRVLTIGDDGRYELLIVGHGSGSFEARKGLWRFKTHIGGIEDYGTYMFIDPNIEHPNRVQFMGHGIPMMAWERTL